MAVAWASRCWVALQQFSLCGPLDIWVWRCHLLDGVSPRAEGAGLETLGGTAQLLVPALPMPSGGDRAHKAFSAGLGTQLIIDSVVVIIIKMRGLFCSVLTSPSSSVGFGAKSELCQLLAVRPWASYLNSLGRTCPAGAKSPSFSQVCEPACECIREVYESGTE